MANIAVLDPDVWISFAWNNDYSLIEKSLASGIRLASSSKAFDELESVLRRKKFAKRIFGNNLQEILSLHQAATTPFDAPPTFSDSPDPKDNYLFDICYTAQADYLVTGDRALLAMKTVRFPDNHTT